MPSLLDTFTIDFAKLEQDRKRIEKGILQAERGAVTDTAKQAERALEAATAAGGLGKLAKAWNSVVYPKTGLAAGPAAVIYPKGGTRTQGAIRGQSQGGRIGKPGGVLVIPTPAAQIGRNKRPTPEEWERVKGIKLVLVERPGKPSLLIAPGVAVSAKTGRVRAASATAIKRGRFASAVIFILMPAVTLKSRFSIGRTLAPFPAKLKADFVRRARVAA
jgi:hypothetical protein